MIWWNSLCSIRDFNHWGKLSFPRNWITTISYLHSSRGCRFKDTRSNLRILGVSWLYEYAGHTGDRKSLVKPCRRGSDSKGFALYHGEWRRHKRSGWQGELTLTASPSSILKRLSLPTPWEDPDYELIITRTVCHPQNGFSMTNTE